MRNSGKPERKKNNFCKDVKVGSLAEEYVISLFRAAGLDPQISKDKDRLFYDLKTDFITTYFLTEIKYDLMSRWTGNVAIEYYNTKKCQPSGIGATRAHLWVHVFSPLDAYICKVSDLKDYLNSNKPIRDVSGGDDNSAMKLYKKDIILPAIFQRLSGQTPEQINQLLKQLLGVR